MLVDLVRRSPLIGFGEARPIWGDACHFCRLLRPGWSSVDLCTPETALKVIWQYGCLPGAVFLWHRIISWLEVWFCHHGAVSPLTPPDNELFSVCWSEPRLAQVTINAYLKKNNWFDISYRSKLLLVFKSPNSDFLYWDFESTVNTLVVLVWVEFTTAWPTAAGRPKNRLVAGSPGVLRCGPPGVSPPSYSPNLFI